MPNTVPTSDRRARIEALLRQLEASGPDALTPDDRGVLANVALGDPRSARLLPLRLTDDAARRRLCATMQAAWLDEEWHIVLDYRDRLRKVAKKVEDPDHPITALILYATWFEHTLNGLLIRQGLLRGLDADQAEAMVREAQFAAKVGWLPAVLGLPAFDSAHKNRLVRLTEARNQYVHYKWRGYQQAAHEDQLRALRVAVADIEPTMDYFLHYYEEHLEEPYITNALSTFAVDRTVLARNA